MTLVGYTVVEYNQASGQPRLIFGAGLYDSPEDAGMEARAEREDIAANGRHEKFAIAEVRTIEEPA